MDVPLLQLNTLSSVTVQCPPTHSLSNTGVYVPLLQLGGPDGTVNAVFSNTAAVPFLGVPDGHS